MVFILHRHIFREMLRVFLLATVGLTLIISLGGVLRPVQEFGLAPRQVVHLLVYLIPVCLTFVLPVAALFASALVYGRFAADNELDACRASGISMWTLVYPGFSLAILVAIANLLLSFHVMPYFAHLAERSMKADAKQILFHSIQRRGFFALPPYLIYADYADPKDGTLFGAVVVQWQEEKVKRITTAEITQVQFDPHDKFNEVQLTVSNARQMGDTADDYWGQVGSLLLKKEFGSLIEDEIKFKKIEEMKQIRADPMRFDPVAKIARTVYTQLTTELLAGDIAEKLRASPGRLYDLKGKPRSIRLSATACTLDKQMVVTLKAPVFVEEYDNRTGQCLRRLRCEKAEIYVEEDLANPRLGLDLHSARDEESGSLLVQYVVADLALPEKIRQSLASGSILRVTAPENVALVLGGPPSSIFTGLQNSLVTEIRHALAHIRSEINSRLVFGIGCVPMILIGISFGIIKREGHLLAAFGASCIPAGALGIAILSGKQVAENVESLATYGILLMWSGLGFLLALTALMYRRLLRH